MLRLSTKAHVERQKKLAASTEIATDASPKVALEEQEGGVSLMNETENPPESILLPPIETQVAAPETAPSPDSPQFSSARRKKNRKKKKKEAASTNPPNQKFASSNAFDALGSNLEDDGNTEKHIDPVTDTKPNWEEEPVLQDKSSWVPMKPMERKPMEMIPPFDSEFWQEFGNTLRIFGTQELLLKIADWPGK